MPQKAKTVFVCQECGTQHPKWQGRCDGCEQWNTLVEEVQQPAEPRRPAASGHGRQPNRPKRLAEVTEAAEARLPLPDQELNRVLDGGLVAGSLTLLGGEPGIGKSTLLLQLAQQLAPRRILYVSGEESERQVKLRADRLQPSNPELYLLAETSVEAILQHANELAPELLIIDSIQTLYTTAITSAPGSIAQVRECTGRLMRTAKDQGVATWLVGHINKAGSLAGPKVMEHMVDTVLEFEGDRHYNFRIVRSIKNRFGATPELGIYEMRPEGLREVSNPSEIFLTQNNEAYSGVAVAASMQGMRPILIEVQALLSPAAYGTPQRSATGLDLKRMSMLLAVLEKKCGFRMGDKDVFLNLVGGIKMEDPALDLAIVLAMVSSLQDQPIGGRSVFAAEVGLTGEVRAVGRIEQRVAEAEKLGFEQILLSANNAQGLQTRQGKIRIVPVQNVQAVFREVFDV